MKYRSLLNANWWPRIIGKVNPLNLIAKGHARARARGKQNSFPSSLRRSAVRSRKISEGTKENLPLFSPRICVPERTRAPRRFYHIKTSKTRRACTLRSRLRDTLFNRRFVLRKLSRSALRRSMRSAELEIGSIRPSCSLGTSPAAAGKNC